MKEKCLQKTLLTSESELLSQCRKIEGLTFRELATRLDISLPAKPSKGWIGQMIEKALGTNAGNLSLPDFTHLGIELKTLPCNALGKPAQSTFITSISLLTIHKETWLTSQCFHKLQRILWVPVEASKKIPFLERRVGRGFLWSPSIEQEKILAEDWNELTFLLTTQLEKVDATIGRYLQVRPKAANAKSLCYGSDHSGKKILTLPRGFYLRCKFTASILLSMAQQP